MIYIALLYVVAVILYNFLPSNANEIVVNIFGNDVPIWRFHINFFRNFVAACAFFELARLSVIQKPKMWVYIGAGLVALSATLFHCCLLIGASGVEEWISAMNNWIWSVVLGMFSVIVLISLIYKLTHDRR